ncbi:MAG TPA: hypothetical protein VFF70_01590 [Anaerolineae bacterium]|nr:hypothetical protein [Anaerolineae bacterium]
MPPSKSSGRPASGAPGVKMLITAASLAATVGGWAMLSNTEGVSSSTTSTPALPPATTASLTVKLQPLPTLVPPPDPKSIAINAQSVIRSSSNQQVAAAPAQAEPAPQVSGLRIVSAPSVVSGGGGSSVAGAPPPATTTRSSKP